MNKLLRRFSAVVVCLLAASTTSVLAQANHIVISQVYGGGGNAGPPAATYKNDFIELYNPTSSAVDLSAYKIGYASSSTGNFGGSAILSGTIQPGRYFLIRASGSSTGMDLPTQDFPVDTSTALSINLNATSGYVVLVPSTTTLTNGVCPTTKIDIVNYGTGTFSCGEGSHAAALANNLAAIRTNPLNDSDDNSVDFTAATPNPHNSSFSPSGLSAFGSASPSAVNAGSTTQLSVTVTPATGPDSTGITVTGNLTSIGGGASVSFPLSGTNTYSYTTNVTTTASGAVTVPFTVTDAQLRSTNGNITITVSQPVPTLAIHTIVGSRPTNPSSIQVSPYVGQQVSFSGIVVGVGSAGFFVEAADGDQDNDPSTPEGLYVYTGSSSLPSVAVVGNVVSVTGTVAAYPAVTASHTPATEITSPTTTLVSTGATLPTPITLTSSMLTTTGGLYQMARYEGMRISIPSLTTVSATDGSTTEASVTVKSNGQFYGVLPGTARPAREPGIDIRDAAVPNTPANVAKFDDNPERLLIDTTFLGGTAINLTSGSTVTGLTGVVDMTYSSDSYYDPARILVDKTYVPVVTMGTPASTVATGGGTGKFSIAAYNVERMFDSDSTNNKYYDPVSKTVKTSSAVNLTPTAFDGRVTKIALGILQNLNAPDVVGLEEVENKGVVQAIATKISSLASTLNLPDPQYVAYGSSAADNTYTSDVGGISTGFLVKPSTFNVTSFQAIGQDETFQHPDTQATTTLNDRPALVLKGGIIRGAGVKDYQVTVIDNHMRSLSGISDSSNYTRLKKELEAESLATYVQSAQASGEHVVSVGDFNAFEFSDGYTDVMGTVTGRVLPSDQVVQPGKAIMNPQATDLITTTANYSTHSYSYGGNTQSLDHIVATSNMMSQFSSYQAVNINSDYPLTMHGDFTNAYSESDHDPVIAYFNTPSPTISGSLTGTANGSSFDKTKVGSTSNGQVYVLSNTGEGALGITSVSTTGDFAASSACGNSLALSSTCNINVVFRPTAAGTRTGSLVVVTAGGTYTAALSGLGAAPVLTATLTPASAAFGSVNLNTTSAAQTFTLTSTGDTQIGITSITASGAFAATNTCGSALDVGLNCTIAVTFKPTALGAATGTLTVVTAGGTYTSSLTGTGTQPDFTLGSSTGSTASLTVSAGSTATLPLTFTATNGFTGTVSVACALTNPAPGVVCNPPASFTLTGTSTQNVTFTTTTRSVSSGVAMSGRSAGAMALSLGLAGVLVMFAGRTRRYGRQAGLLLVLLGVTFAATGCGDSAPSTNPYGTPAGAYTYTVTSTSGSLSHSVVVTLNVQ